MVDRVTFLILFIPLLLSLSACGQIDFAPNLVSVPSSANKVTSSSQNSSTNLEYSCSSSATILPYQPLVASQTNHYTVCTLPNPGDHWSILVHGETLSSSSICFFPAQFSTNGQYRWIQDPEKLGYPIYLCAPATSTGAYFNFPSLQKANTFFNAAYIIEQPDLTSMNYCLVNNFSNCPAYSIGTFR